MYGGSIAAMDTAITGTTELVQPQRQLHTLPATITTGNDYHVTSWVNLTPSDMFWLVCLMPLLDQD